MISSATVLEVTFGVVSLLAFISLAALPCELAGQTPYDFPIPAAGDRFVYANDDGTPTALLCRFGGTSESFAFQDLRDGFWPYTYAGPMEEDSNGVLCLGFPDPKYRKVVFYPLRMPTEPVVRFDGMEWKWNAFDTTVFGRHISAITYRSGFGIAQRIRTVGEYYGLLYDRDKGAVLRLNSAVIGGVPYNRETVPRAYVSICEDRIMQYRVESPGGNITYKSYSHSADRIENGIRYALHPLFRSPLCEQLFPYGIYVTAGPGGVTRIGGGISIPATVSIGDLIGYTFFITDTSSIQFAGGLKRVLRAVKLDGYAHGVFEDLAIVENVGVLHTSGSSWLMGDWCDELVYYSGCGESWGTPVSVPDEVPTPTRMSLSVSPSPSSVQQGLATVWITSTTSGEAALRVTDILGKLVHEERIRVDAGSHPVHLGIDGYTSGMYIVTVTVAAEQAWTKLLVR